MPRTKKISSTVDVDLLNQAIALVGENSIAETVRVGLRAIVEGGAPRGLPLAAAGAEPEFEMAEAVTIVAAELSEDDIEKWTEKFNDAIFALTVAEGELRAQGEVGEEARVNAARNKLNARKLALGEGRVNMPSPTNDTLERIRGLVKDVEDKTNQAAKADSIVAASLELAEALGAA